MLYINIGCGFCRYNGEDCAGDRDTPHRSMAGYELIYAAGCSQSVKVCQL